MPDEKRDITLFLKELARGTQFIDKSGLFRDIPDYNPDELAGKKGIETYDQMIDRDGQVKSCLLFKKYARLSTGWTLHPASKDPMDIEIRDFWKWVFENMEGSVDGVIEDLMHGYERGFAVIEIILEPIEEGPFAGKFGIKRLKAKRQKDFFFKNDEFGNLDSQIGLQQLYAGEKHPLPQNKFIIYSHDMKDDNHYGTSDLRAAYKPFFAKDLIERYWPRFLEEYGGPIVQAKYPKEAVKERIREIWNTVKKMMTGKKIVYPSDWEVTLMQASQESGGSFEKGLNYFNKMIARAILVPSLLQDQNQETGSYSLGETHVGSFVWILKHDGKTIEEVINEQLIRRVTKLNYPVTSYPEWKFKEFTEEDLAAIATMLTSLVDRGIKISTSYIYDRFGIPEPEAEEDVMQKSPQPSSISPSRLKGKPSSLAGPVSPEVEQMMEFGDFPPGCYRQPTEFEEKVNWPQIDEQEKRELEASAGRMGLILGSMRDAVVGETQKKKKLQRTISRRSRERSLIGREN
jgi:phage gp29-like protein